MKSSLPTLEVSGRGLLCFPRTPVNAPLIRLAAVYRNGLVLETGTACSWHQSRVRSEHISMAGAEIKRLTPGTIGPGQRQDSPRVPGFLLLLGWPLIAVDASRCSRLHECLPQLGTTPRPRSEGRLALRAEQLSVGQTGACILQEPGCLWTSISKFTLRALREMPL